MNKGLHTENMSLSIK